MSRPQILCVQSTFILTDCVESMHWDLVWSFHCKPRAIFFALGICLLFAVQGRPNTVHPYPTSQASPGVMHPVTNPVHAGQPKRGGAVATPAVKKANKKPGCIKKLSHKSQVFQRSDCGTMIISGVRIALAVTSITAVASAFAGTWCIFKALFALFEFHFFCSVE